MKTPCVSLQGRDGRVANQKDPIIPMRTHKPIQRQHDLAALEIVGYAWPGGDAAASERSAPAGLFR